MYKKIAIFLVLLSSLSFPTYSFGWFPFTALPSYDKIEQRQKFANQLLIEINKIYSSIPDLSPQEEKWLNSESHNENLYKKLKAFSSNENILKTTKAKIRDIKWALEAIYEKKYKSRNQEMLLWLGVLESFMQSGTAYNLSFLVNNKVITIDSKIKYDSQDLLQIAGDRISREILQKILARYLMDYK